MSTQSRLFYDSFEDAAREVVTALGGPKAVGVRLWPAKTPEAARTRLLDVLNLERAEKLRTEEIVALMKWGRQVGCHAIAEWVCCEAGYARPVPIEPEDERDQLQRDFLEAAKSVAGIAERLTRLGFKVAA